MKKRSPFEFFFTMILLTWNFTSLCHPADMVTKDRHDILGGSSVLTSLNGSVTHESRLSSSEANSSDLGMLFFFCVISVSKQPSVDKSS